MAIRVGLMVSLLLVVLCPINVSADEVSFSKLLDVRQIDVEYVAVKLTARSGTFRTGKPFWSHCRNHGSPSGDDFCWRAGKQRFRIPLPEFGWMAYELVRPRILWQHAHTAIRWPPGLTYQGEIAGGIALRQHGSWTSVALEIRF